MVRGTQTFGHEMYIYQDIDIKCWAWILKQIMTDVYGYDLKDLTLVRLFFAGNHLKLTFGLNFMLKLHFVP